MKGSICGIVIGEASSVEEAKRLAEAMKNCPNLVASGTSSNKLYSVYIVPEEKKWWLKYPETNPKATGLEKARVYIIQNLLYPEKFAFRMPEKKRDCSMRGELLNMSIARRIQLLWLSRYY
jgi:hypothetical protein